MQISEMVASSIRMCLPVLLAALGATYSEKSGIVNIGLEGMMITGAFWGATSSYFCGPYVGLLGAVLAGMLLASVHAATSVTFRVNQIVSGVALNTFAYGATRFASTTIFKMATTTPGVPRLPSIDIPGLSSIGWLAPAMTALSPVIILAFLLVPVTKFVLERTVFGLRLRSAGENPLAADTVGVNISAMRYAGVIISGGFAGLAGGYLAIEHTGMYVEGMTQGAGFIGLAAMIFGNWQPVGAMLASLLFGLAEGIALNVESEIIPYQFIKMIPYALTIAVLASAIRRATPPAASGVPYERAGE
jgi:simple sugar transport system permease protein